MKKAFTLAEVLITLMIIGIVAALTIPSVISNYQQQEFKTGLKKAVSVLNEAIQTNIAQEGETPYDNDDLFTYLQRHMSVIKTEYKALNQGNGGGTSSNGMLYTTDGMRFEFGSSADDNIVLYESGIKINKTPRFRRWPDGSFGGFGSGNQANCGSYGLDKNIHNTTNPPCVVLVDVNGDKKPNPIFEERTLSFGNKGEFANYLYPAPSDKKLTDVFNILVTEEKAIPFGVVAQRAMYSK